MEESKGGRRDWENKEKKEEKPRKVEIGKLEGNCVRRKREEEIVKKEEEKEEIGEMKRAKESRRKACAGEERGRD